MMDPALVWAPVIATGVAFAALSAYVWQRRAVPGALALSALLLSGAVWGVAYGFELRSATLGGRLFWRGVALPGMAAAPVCFLILSLEYGGWKVRRKAVLALSVAPAAVQILRWTNPWHHLYFKQVWLDTTGLMPSLGRSYGWGFWVFMAYSDILIALAVVITLRLLFRSGTARRWQAALFLSAGLLPWIANLAWFFGFTRLDFTVLGLAASGAAFTWILFRHRFQAIVPVAWKTVTESMADGAVVIDSAGRVMDLNPAASRLLDRRREEVIGRMAVTAFASRPELIPFWTASEEKREIAFASDGRECICEVQASAVRDRNGWPIASLLTIRDVTAARQAALELEKAKQAAEALGVAKARFLATMSHEIRTPMNGILGMSGLLLEAPLNPDQKEFAAAISNSARHLLSIVNDVLDFSKIEAGKLDLESIPFDLEELVRETAAPIREEACGKGLAFKLTYDDEAPRRFVGDPCRLRQVLGKLLGNAVKFTDAGEVEFSVAQREMREGVALVVFSVRDTGIGIAEDKLEAIFEDFTQVDPSVARRHGGTGLGLAISRRLVASMGGSIQAASALGRGSRFTVEAPLRLDDSQAAMANANRRGKGLRGDCRVLLAEDNPVNQRLGVRSLEKLGCRVDVAADGAEAIERAVKGAYDLIFMDFQMPRVNGLEATREIRNLGVRTPIVALTASAADETRQAWREAGIEDYLTKPVEPPAWRAALEKWT